MVKESQVKDVKSICDNTIKTPSPLGGWGASFLIGAATSNSGKTTFTMGLLRALRDRGLKVQPYKCGPDYIDTMFHDGCMRASWKAFLLFHKRRLAESGYAQRSTYNWGYDC